MQPWIDKTFADALVWAAREHGSREAVVYGDTRLTYEALLERCDALGRALIAMGVERGDMVSLWMADCVEWVVARYAVPAIGAILVPINTRFRSSELAYVLRQSDSRMLIMGSGFSKISYYDLLEQLIPDYREQPREGWRAEEYPRLQQVVTSGNDLPGSMHDFQGLLDWGRSLIRENGGDAVLAERRAATRPQDVAQILYTSGTTSFPKGAMVCHGPLLQNNHHTVSCFNLMPGDSFLASVPMFSATGTSYSLTVLLAGAKLVIADHFEPAYFCRLVEQEGINATFFVDAMVQDLRAYPDLRKHDLSSLRTGAGAPLSAASFRYLVEEFKVPGLLSVYGMSETSNSVSRSRWDDSLDYRLATNGRINPGVQVRIAHPETGEPQPPGELGEIQVGGFTVMKGYYNKPEENALTFCEDGWLRSGDLGMFSEAGDLIYKGRLKEMIKPGGFNVAVSEIEAFLKTHEAVQEAAVVGVPDARLGEVGYAYVELAPGAGADAEELIAFCKAHIASYKVPRHIEFVTAWPMTGSGKIKKGDLKEAAAAQI